VTTLPSTDIGDITLAYPDSISIPSDFANYAALGYFVPNDFIEVLDKVNITMGTEDGTSGNQVVIYLRAGYTGTLDLNSNDYITVFAHPSATVSNSGGTDVVVTPHNGAAGL